MIITRAAFAAALAAISVSSAWAADPPAKAAVLPAKAAAQPAKAAIRPATVAELPPDVAASVRARPAQPLSGTAQHDAAQTVVIDPLTGTIVDVPPPPRGTPDYLEPEQPKSVDMSLRQYPNGFLYIDTSGYQFNSTATIDADGNIQVGCDEPGHDHSATPQQEPQP